MLIARYSACHDGDFAAQHAVHAAKENAAMRYVSSVAPNIQHMLKKCVFQARF